MAEVRDERQKERAEARKGRRSDVDESSDQRDESSLDLRRAAATAVTAALAGALAGAAKAVVDKRGRSTIEPKTDEGAHDDDQQAASDPEDEAELTDEHEDDDEPNDEPNEEPARASEEDGAQRQEDPREQDDDSEQTGASSDDVASIIARAKQHVEAVIGSEAESVSGVERSNGNWRVNVEVLQMRRVPESTDILASYAVVLDGDGDLISVQELRRYRRSQAEGDR
jgi:hypothetical protein